MDNMLVRADEMIEELRVIEKEKAKYKEIADKRIEAIKMQLQGKLDTLDNNASFLTQQLKQIAEISDTKETKTQYKLELLAGDVIIKKARKRFKRDNKAILEAIQDERQDLVRTREVKSLDWAKFKEELDIIDDVIVNKQTGEVIDLPGLEIDEVEERVEIK